MKKTSVKIPYNDYLTTGMFGRPSVTIAPFKKVLEHVNQLGLDGFKIEQIDFYDEMVDLSSKERTYSKYTEIVFHSSRVEHIAFYDNHGQGD